MGAVSWRNRKDIAAFIQQRFNGGAIALVPAAPRGQQDTFFLARGSSMYQCHVILRQLRCNTGSLHQWVFVRTTAWQSMAYFSGSAPFTAQRAGIGDFPCSSLGSICALDSRLLWLVTPMRKPITIRWKPKVRFVRRADVQSCSHNVRSITYIVVS